MISPSCRGGAFFEDGNSAVSSSVLDLDICRFLNGDGLLI